MVVHPPPVVVISVSPDERDAVVAISPPSSDEGDRESCYICLDSAGMRHDGSMTELLAVCRCSASGAMPICKECFLAWLERELERQGERATFKCLICKEPYRLRRARKPARMLCYALGERLLTSLFFASFFTGCVIVAYIMISLTALLSGHMATYRILVGGAEQSIFRAAEITLLFAFIVGSAAIVLTFLWHSFSPCGVPLPERRALAAIFDLRALDKLAAHPTSGARGRWHVRPLAALRGIRAPSSVVPVRAPRRVRPRPRVEHPQPPGDEAREPAALLPAAVVDLPAAACGSGGLVLAEAAAPPAAAAAAAAAVACACGVQRDAATRPAPG